jgi:hypothetical protein
MGLDDNARSAHGSSVKDYSFAQQNAGTERARPQRLLSAPIPSDHLMLLHLQRTAGNAAVSNLIAGSVIQRQEEDDGYSNSDARCAGTIVSVDELSDETDSDSGSNVQTYAVGQPVTVQRQGGSGQAAGGSCPNPQWSDYQTVPENYSTFAAQSAPVWHAVNNRYAILEDQSRQWAKQSAKTGQRSAQLLRHEWYHFRLQCVLAGKANAALAAGANPRTITSQAATSAQRQSDSYDSDTTNGVNAAMQTAWENDIDNDVPAFPFT